MTQTLILYPSIAMFALTAVCIGYLGYSRFSAIHRREVRISYFRTYDEGAQPPRLHLLGRHVQNHFEVPPLFHLGVVLSFVTQSVTPAALACAWAYVVLRVVHTGIHLGSNNVSHRFFTFGASLLALCGLWGLLFASLLVRAA